MLEKKNFKRSALIRSSDRFQRANVPSNSIIVKVANGNVEKEWSAFNTSSFEFIHFNGDRINLDLSHPDNIQENTVVSQLSFMIPSVMGIEVKDIKKIVNSKNEIIESKILNANSLKWVGLEVLLKSNSDENNLSLWNISNEEEELKVIVHKKRDESFLFHTIKIGNPYYDYK